MKTMTRQTAAKLTIAALLAAYAVALAGCNTVSGAGQDLKDASEGTKKAIQGDK